LPNAARMDATVSLTRHRCTSSRRPFLISPDGHLLSPRWRWAARVTVAGLVLNTLGTLTIRPGEFLYGQEYGDRTVSGPLHMAGVGCSTSS